MLNRRPILLAAVAPITLAVWIAHDLTDSTRHDPRDLDGREVARLETAMWRSYYEHHPVRLFLELTRTLRSQFHLPFWRSTLGAYHAARAAVIFQRGRFRGDYRRALPDLDSYYVLIRRSSTIAFDPGSAASLELEWWIVHRERARHTPADLERALAQLQSEIYRLPEARFTEHAHARAEAMLLRDARAESGSLSEADWQRIAALLDISWTSLRYAVGAP